MIELGVELRSFGGVPGQNEPGLRRIVEVI